MQDDHSPENDGEKKPDPVQFSLLGLSLWVTLSALIATLVAVEQFALLALLFVVLLITVVALGGTDLLVGRGLNNRLIRAIVFVLLWTLICFAIAMVIPAY